MLELVARLADHEWHLPRLMQEPEVAPQQFLESVQRGVALAIPLEAPDPLLLAGVFLEPGVGRGQHEQATPIDALVDHAQEAARAVEAVDEVGGEHQVIAAQHRLEVAGVALRELELVAQPSEAEFVASLDSRKMGKAPPLEATEAQLKAFATGLALVGDEVAEVELGEVVFGGEFDVFFALAVFEVLAAFLATGRFFATFRAGLDGAPAFGSRAEILSSIRSKPSLIRRSSRCITSMIASTS